MVAGELKQRVLPFMTSSAKSAQPLSSECSLTRFSPWSWEEGLLVHPFLLCLNSQGGLSCVSSFNLAELMFLETSALTGENVEEAFLKCARTILNKIESGGSSSPSRETFLERERDGGRPVVGTKTVLCPVVLSLNLGETFLPEGEGRTGWVDMGTGQVGSHVPPWAG